jgi:hypothetical protein
MTIALVSFIAIFVGALIGMFLRRFIPERHLAPDSRDVVKLLAGLIATQAALVIGLLVSSAKNSFDSMNDGVTEAGAKIIVLDQLLSRYGPEADPVRRQLQRSLGMVVDELWPEARATTRPSPKPDAVGVIAASDDWLQTGDMLRALKPETEPQRLLKAQTIQIAVELTQLRWLLIQKTYNPVPMAFLTVLIFWFTVLFATFGVLTPSNATVHIAMLLGALSIAGGIFLILDLNSPLDGIIKASPAPLVNALHRIGQ